LVITPAFSPNPLGHFGGCPPRKRHEQDPPRIGAVDNEVSYPVRQGVGLAGTGPGDHQERAAGSAIQFSDTMLYGTTLF
jgi:hypothetical protein